jgi:hypothetical protein
MTNILYFGEDREMIHHFKKEILDDTTEATCGCKRAQ